MKSTEQILEDIFDNGSTAYEFKIGKKFKIKIRNITSADYLAIDAVLNDTKRTAIGYAQEFIIERIARVVVSINGKIFTDLAECKKFLLSRPSSLTNKILEEHKKFEQKIKEALELDEIEENFFEKDVSQEKPKRSRKASTSEKQDR